MSAIPLRVHDHARLALLVFHVFDDASTTPKTNQIATPIINRSCATQIVRDDDGSTMLYVVNA